MGRNQLAFLHISFLCGVTLSFLKTTPTLGILWIVLAFSLFVLFLCPRKWSILFLGIVFFTLGGIRLHYEYHWFSQSPLLGSFEEHVLLRGQICEDRDQRQETLKLVFCSQERLVESQWSSFHGKILLDTNVFAPFAYGDHVEIYGVLEEPGEFDGFSYTSYLQMSGVHGVLRSAKITLLERKNQVTFFGSIFALRASVEEKIGQLWHEPYSSFLAGLLIGSRKGIPPDILDHFQQTGLTHIIAISGYNITLVIVVIMTLFSWMTKPMQIFSASCAIVIFCILTGASAAVIRASIMGILSLMALWSGQQKTVTSLMLGSLVIMALWRPLSLFFDVGLQLSFLALCGLLWCADPLERWCKKLPELLGIREAFQLTVAATISTTPIILYHFGTFSILSPLVNVIVAPFIPLAMLFGFFALVVSLLWSEFGAVLTPLATLPLEIILSCAKWAAQIPFNYQEGLQITLPFLFLLYGVLGLGIIWYSSTIKRVQYKYTARIAQLLQVV